MANIVSLISGKGGSGKTTVALSMASLLSSLGVKVLLVDCDMSTNGATYFYEDKLPNTNASEILSFSKVLLWSDSLNDVDSATEINRYIDEKIKNHYILNVDDNLAFMPSITSTYGNTLQKSYTSLRYVDLEDILERIVVPYDVVIFDCQAGYTEELRRVLRISDSCLTVMEADAISSAANRNLHLKIGDILEKKKVYQVLNKASDDEYETYSKISGGTLFTNIETIRFDWKVRRAFAVAQIPNLKSTSALFGETISNICKVLFREKTIVDKISEFEITLKLSRIEEQKKSIQQKIDEATSTNANSVDRVVSNFFILIAMSMLLVMVYFMGTGKLLSSFSDYELMIALIGACYAALIATFLNNYKSKLGQMREMRKNKAMLSELEEESRLLKKKL